MTRLAAAAAAASVALTGCASFPAASAAFSAAPSLTFHVATVVPPSPAAPLGTTSPPPDARATSGTRPTPAPSTSGASTPGSSRAEDPCAPPHLPVVAVCLDDPWGLAPLPDGQSALVGERTSGRILRVTAGRQPAVVTTIADVDASHGGGLLGIALSPYYAEDSLFYAYVTTSRDSRIVRIAPVGEPKVIVSGLPVAGGGGPVGGSIAFGADGLLYAAAGDSIRRYDTFGKPAGPRAVDGLRAAPGGASDGAVVATGLTDPTGICPLPDGRVGVLDHRAAGDALIVVTPGADYSALADGATLWTFSPGSGGATDCAISGGALLASSRSAAQVTRIGMRAAGGFTGEPEPLMDGDFGLLRTVVTGPGDVAWLTTANGVHGTGTATRLKGAAPSDDRVIVLAAGGGGGDGGAD